MWSRLRNYLAFAWRRLGDLSLVSWLFPNVWTALVSIVVTAVTAVAGLAQRLPPVQWIFLALFAGVIAVLVAHLVLWGIERAHQLGMRNPLRSTTSEQRYSGHEIFDLIQQIDPALHAGCAAGKWKPCHDEMYKQLRSGAFVATGLPPSMKEIVIPAAQWQALQFVEVNPKPFGSSGYNENRDWHRARDASGGLVYADIKISRVTTTLSHGSS